MSKPKSDLETWAGKVQGSGVPVPVVQQETNYTCGPAIAAAVLRYFGTIATESQLADEAGTGPDGTSFEAMADVFRKHGMNVSVRADLTPKEIKRLLQRGYLVVLALQAWNEIVPPLGGYTGEWDSGHYVVPVAVDSDSILFQDPAVAGRRAYLTHAEFLSRWHSFDANGVYDQGYGLVVIGKGPVLWKELRKLPPPVRMG